KGPDNGFDVGSRVKVKIVKNKCAPPFQSAEFDILFNEGISHIGSLIDIGVEKGIIDKKGTWFSYQNTRLGQGREAAREELKANPKLAQEIESTIHAKLAQGVLPKAPLGAKEEALSAE
ncbi:MAG TPA: DNA recombination/repair protein RecA, partial [Parachlamydiales bacterium]|nr:DNA recombination/repair protein RecA [Parachlamydiales bacterium]